MQQKTQNAEAAAICNNHRVSQQQVAQELKKLFQ
jgi:hypothetical protein